jgi:antitoxin component YwqK of YwqJK toxin-antitoxin module
MKILAAITFSLFMLLVNSGHAQVEANDMKIPDTANKMDDQGKKTGYWIEKQGDLTSKGEYISNRKVKNWVTYYSNNVIYKIEYFTNGIKDGISIQFDRKGKMTLVENYKNGLTHGQTIYYGQFSETPLSESEYAFGKKNGLFRQYYENGKIQEESNFTDDQKNGFTKWFNKNGRMIATYHYLNGNFDGIQKTYYENDSVQSVYYYQDNKLSGDSKEFYRNGKLKITGKYVSGEKEGPWTEYDELGKVRSVTRYKNGQEQKKK